MAKQTSKGSLLQISIASVYTTITQCISVNGPASEVQESETPTLDGGVGITHSITGWVEPGASDFEVYWDPLLPVHQALTALTRAPAIKQWKQSWSVGTPITYDGILKSFTPAASAGEMLKASGSIQLADLPTS